MQRRHRQTTVIAIKGASETGTEREIFTLPPRLDHRNATKAARTGLRVCILGTKKAKDLVLGINTSAGRIRVAGTGPGRFYVYRDVRAGYWEQLTNELKAPNRPYRGKLIWQRRPVSASMP